MVILSMFIRFLRAFIIVLPCLLASGCHISSQEMDQNAAFVNALMLSPRVRKLGPVMQGERLFVHGGGASSSIYLNIYDNPDSRSKNTAQFSATEVATMLEEIRNVSSRLGFERSIKIYDSFSARTRYIVLAKGRGIRAVHPISSTHASNE